MTDLVDDANPGVNTSVADDSSSEAPLRERPPSSHLSIARSLRLLAVASRDVFIHGLHLLLIRFIVWAEARAGPGVTAIARVGFDLEARVARVER